MPTLTITKTYANATVLNESDLDNIRTSIETFINVTKLDASNIQISAIADAVGSAMTSVGADSIATAMTTTGANAILANFNVTEGYRLQADSTGVAQFASPNYVQASSDCTLSAGTSSVYTDITNATVTITARNRPIMVLLQSTSTSTTPSEGAIAYTGGNGSGVSFALLRAGSALEKQSFNAANGIVQYYPPGAVCFIDRNPGTGSKVYKLQYIVNLGLGSITLSNCRLLAIEL